MEKFFKIWLAVTAAILVILSIPLFGLGNPGYSLLGAILLFFLVVPFSVALMGIIWWALLPREEKFKMPRIAATVAMLLPLALVIAYGAYYYQRSVQHTEFSRRLMEYTVHTHIMTIHLEKYTTEQRLYFLPQGEEDPRYSLLQMQRVIIDDEHHQRIFEDIFMVQLPSIDFSEYFFRVLPGQQYDGWRGSLETLRIDPYTINVYQVNIVR